MTYSLGFVLPGSEALDEAQPARKPIRSPEGQRRKYAEIARRMGLQPEDRVPGDRLVAGAGSPRSRLRRSGGAGHGDHDQPSRNTNSPAVASTQDLGLNDRVAIELRGIIRDTVGAIRPGRLESR